MPFAHKLPCPAILPDSYSTLTNVQTPSRGFLRAHCPSDLGWLWFQSNGITVSFVTLFLPIKITHLEGKAVFTLPVPAPTQEWHLPFRKIPVSGTQRVSHLTFFSLRPDGPVSLRGLRLPASSVSGALPHPPFIPSRPWAWLSLGDEGSKVREAHICSGPYEDFRSKDESPRSRLQDRQSCFFDANEGAASLPW